MWHYYQRVGITLRIERLQTKHIRDRIAHYRKGHSDDLIRLLQVMRDIDNGFWEFCTSYNDINPILPQDRDPVTKKYFELDPFAPKEISDNKWAVFGSVPDVMFYTVSVNVIKRKWAEYSETVDGVAGYLYDVRIHMRNERQFDYNKFLKRTKRNHSQFVHICLDTFSTSLRVTIPAILGSEKIIELIDDLIQETEYSFVTGRRINVDDKYVQKISDKWPEYVLGPENPLTFLDPEMPCAFFNAGENG